MSRSEAFVSPTAAQNMRLTFNPDGAAIYKPIASTSPPYQPPTAASGNGVNIEGSAGVGGGGAPLPHGLNMNVNMSSVEPLKRKRGRPRKYGSDGNMSLALSPTTAPGAATPSSAGFSSPPSTAADGGGAVVPAGGSASPTSGKKSRGRPPGSGRKRQLEALGSVGIGFTPHVIVVNAGEDVCSKIMSFSQNGPRAVCILSANGAISNVTLRQPAISGGTVTYEGRFEILSLSGSFLLSENEGHRSRTGGLSVSLSGSDGRVLGGGVAGLLTAASPVQVVVGSFVADGRKEAKQPKHNDLFSAPPPIQQGGSGGGLTGGSSPSHGTLSESSGGPGSPLNQSSGACNNSNTQAMPNMTWK